MIRLILIVLAALGALLPASLTAHEVRPAYLEIRETGGGAYDIFWKVPARGDAVLALDVVFPPACSDATPRTIIRDSTAVTARWSIRCEGGLEGAGLRIDGLDRTLVETIVRFERQGGTIQTARLFKGATVFTPDGRSTIASVAATYLPLGVEHILLGFDHLCFVLALLLLVDGLRRLFWAITAFTIAHSITLAAAALGHVEMPPAPVEALIAFSIVIVAAEAVRHARGHPSPTAERPWTVAFAFGLLHGLGFAGALAETGLPGDAIPLALLFFNLGVELGQIAFVLAVLLFARVVARLGNAGAPALRLVPAYSIGCIAAFWTIERFAALIV